MQSLTDLGRKQPHSGTSEAKMGGKWSKPVVCGPVAHQRNSGRLHACPLRGSHNRKQLLVLFPRF